MNIAIKRRCYYRTDISNGNRIIGFLISRPQGYQLHSNNPALRWFRRRYFKSPADLVAAIGREVT